MTATNDPVAAAAAAWRRIGERGRLDWADYKLIGRALQIGRDEALKAAGCDRPFGKRYTRAMASWLAEHGLAGISQQVRWRLLQCMSELTAIETWLAGVDEQRRNRLHHPDAVWMHYQRSLQAEHAPPSRDRIRSSTHGKATHAGYPARPSRPTQDMVRLVASALRSSWTIDTYVLASAMLQMMVENREAFIAFLADPPAKPAPKPRPPRIEAPVALELAHA